MSQFILVYAPAKIKDIKVFTPKRTIAVMSQILQDNNVNTAIYDFGIPEAIQYYSDDTTNKGIGKNDTKENKIGLWLSRILGSGKQKKDIKNSYLRWIYQNIKISSHTVCILFWVENREDLIVARILADEIRKEETQNKIHIIGAGPYLNHTGPYVITNIPEFNGILINHSEISILPLWEHLTSGKDLHSVPNYVYLEGNEIRIGPVNRLLTLDDLPIPSYDNYEALQKGGKLNIFTLEQVRDGRFGYSEPYTLKHYINATPENLLEEIGKLREKYSTWTFHIEGEMINSSDVQSLSLALLKSAHFITYSRNFHCSNIQGDWVHSLHLSGCRAISVNIPTGSQRLLSKYYGIMRTISSLETAISAFVSSHFFTTIQCSYPCPEEDRHTFAETLRFLKRIKPDSVQVEPVYLLPDSMWWQNMDSFSFNVNPTEYIEWLAGESHSTKFLQWKPFDLSTMIDEIVKLNITPQIDALMGIITHVLQISKEQKFFRNFFEKVLLEGDADSLQGMVSQFNNQLKKRIREEEWNIRKYDFKAVAN